MMENDPGTMIENDPLLEEFEKLEREVAQRARRAEEERLAREAELIALAREKERREREAEIAARQARCQHERLDEFSPTRADGATHQCIDCGTLLPPEGTRRPVGPWTIYHSDGMCMSTSAVGSVCFATGLQTMMGGGAE